MRRFAEKYISQALLRLRTAESAAIEGEHAYCFRQSQEAVELALKAALRIKGVEYPKFHDVGDVLLRVRELYPEWFEREAEKAAEISRKLAEKREAAMYGDESLGLPPSQVVSEEETKKGLEEAKWVVSLCERLMKELK
jgi:HEPN domain-containing protein